jgi:ribonuclease HI
MSTAASRKRKKTHDEAGWYAVAVGARPGVYMSSAEARSSAGDHPCPLIVPVDSAASGLKVVNMFTSAKSVLYADGSSNLARAIAGYGVYWGTPGDSRNVSEFIDGTNNIAELMAILTAVKALGEADMPAIIATDSRYAMDCVTRWYKGFETRGWVTIAGTPVLNAELIRETHAELQKKPNISLFHVRGHVGHVGNEAADKLAKAGSLKPHASSE